MDREPSLAGKLAGAYFLTRFLSATFKFWFPPFLIWTCWAVFQSWQEERQLQQRIEFVEQESVNWRDRAK